jgi:hypothetical protein
MKTAKSGDRWPEIPAIFGRNGADCVDWLTEGLPLTASSRARLTSQRLQYPVTQSDRIAHAPLRELDHLLGNDIRLAMIAIAQTESEAHLGIGACHHRDRFRLERFVFEQAVDGHT